jgi:hypothetical protein
VTCWQLSAKLLDKQSIKSRRSSAVCDVLEPCALRGACTVLRGLGSSNALWLPDHELQEQGYVLRLLHPRQTHQFHERQGLRAKTDRLDALTIEKRVVEWGGTSRVCAKRAGGHLPRTRAPPHPTLG